MVKGGGGPQEILFLILETKSLWSSEQANPILCRGKHLKQECHGRGKKKKAGWPRLEVEDNQEGRREEVADNSQPSWAS